MVDYLSLLSQYTEGEHPQTVPAFLIHSALVTRKALEIAENYMAAHPEVEIDLRLLEEMCMLHDIGIFSTDTPVLHLTGQGHYVTHVDKGYDILMQENLPKHALGARNHMDVPKEQIERRQIPLRPVDHIPTTIEEEILSVADNYYSKRFDSLFHERSYEEILEFLAPFDDAAERFTVMHAKYCEGF